MPNKFRNDFIHRVTLFLCAALFAILVAYLMTSDTKWLIYSSAGLVVVIIISLVMSQNVNSPPKNTVIHRNKEDFARVVTDLVATYTESGKSTGELTVEDELSSLISSAMELTREESLALDKQLAMGSAEPTVDTIVQYILEHMSEQQMLRLGGEALWVSSVQYPQLG